MSRIYLNGLQVQNGHLNSIPTSYHQKQNTNMQPIYNVTSLFPSGFDHAYASNRSDKATVELLTKEIQNLKQILTIHLNLIEQQSKKIESKDQALLSLQDELQFLKRLNAQKRINDQKSIACICSKNQLSIETQTELLVNDSRKVAPVKKRRRHTVSSNETAKNRKTLHRRTTSENDTKDPTYCTRATSHTQLVTKSKRTMNKKSKGCRMKSIQRDVMTSSEPYFISLPYWGDIECVGSTVVVKHDPDTAGCSSWDNDTSDSSVKVPSWRFVDLSPVYDPEGTEDTSDAVYEKRHRKYELEEQRQRRWEEQEFRNQLYKEKLKANRMRTARGARKEKPSSPLPAEDMFNSFDPNLIEAIEIVDELPITAFGVSMPFIFQEEFDLPNNINETALETTKKRK